MRGMATILPDEPDALLDRETVRQLLRECVTVVKPGEVLLLRAADGMNPQQVREIHWIAASWLEYHAPSIKALVLPPLEIAIIPAGSEPPGEVSGAA